MGGSGDLESTDFISFHFGGDVVVLKGLVLDSFYFGMVLLSSKDDLRIISTLREFGGPERTGFQEFLLWEDVVVP